MNLNFSKVLLGTIAEIHQPIIFQLVNWNLGGYGSQRAVSKVTGDTLCYLRVLLRNHSHYFCVIVLKGGLYLSEDDVYNFECVSEFWCFGKGLPVLMINDIIPLLGFSFNSV